MATNEITFTGTSSGDMECFCWDKVPLEDIIKIIGQEVFDTHKALEKECVEDMADVRDIKISEEEVEKIVNKALSRLYPSCVIEACLGKEPEQDKVYKFTVKVEEV
jgi:hypothetical protein